MANPIFTIGHSDHTFSGFADLLKSAEVDSVVDVRKLPGSTANPQFDRDVLADALALIGVGYRHAPELGGRRPANRVVPPEVNALWRNRSFHNYADFALSSEFGEGLARLREEGLDRRVAVMCSEAVWWRCHRRIIADHLLAHGGEASHIMSAAHADPARLTPGAMVGADRSVTYPLRPDS